MNQILSYLKPYKTKLIIGLIVKSTATFSELMLPVVLAHVLDYVVPTKQLGTIIWYGVLMIVFSIVGYAGNIYANRHAAKVSTLAIQNVRNDAYEKILYFTNKSTDYFKLPSLISRMTTDTYHIYRLFNVVQRIGIRAPIILLGSLILMMSLDMYLAFVLISLLPVISVVIFFISKASVPFYDRLQESLDNMIRIVRERISGIRVVKAQSMEAEEKETFKLMNIEVSKKEQLAGTLVSALNPTMNLIVNLGLVFIIYLGSQRVSKGLSTTGNIIAFLSYFTLILQAFMAINRIFMLFSKAAASSFRVVEILNRDNTIEFVPPVTENEMFQIEFEHVYFSYSDDEKLHLRDISFQIKPGETFGIIGSTGSGKSTIAQLLLRFYDASSGEIRICGRSIKSFSLPELRNMFGVVFQNDALFTDTVENNIRFGRDVQFENIMDAASRAQASEFIDDLGSGYEEKVLRGGANFSGGQRQRMLIARALASDPDILILDDASSALDYKTDASMRQTLKHLNTTTIYIAQRISTVMQANQILVLDEGSVVGLGTHEELLASCITYQELYEIQMGGGL